jgi:hypothetical protein
VLRPKMASTLGFAADEMKKLGLLFKIYNQVGGDSQCLIRPGFTARIVRPPIEVANSSQDESFQELGDA